MCISDFLLVYPPPPPTYKMFYFPHSQNLLGSYQICTPRLLLNINEPCYSKIKIQRNSIISCWESKKTCRNFWIIWWMRDQSSHVGPSFQGQSSLNGMCFTQNCPHVCVITLHAEEGFIMLHLSFTVRIDEFVEAQPSVLSKGTRACSSTVLTWEVPNLA